MSEPSTKGAAAGNSAPRTRLALIVLIAIAAFVGYGVYERSRLIAAQAQEKQAIASIRQIKGTTMESDSKDWRQLFVPDQPQTAVRVGTVSIPILGEGPDYTKKVVDQLRVFTLCEQLFLADGPVERTEGKGGMGGGAPKPQVTEEVATGPLETLDVAVIRKEFPTLKIHGEETAAKGAAAKAKAKEELAAKRKERQSKEGGTSEGKSASNETSEKKEPDAPSEANASAPGDASQKKQP